MKKLIGLALVIVGCRSTPATHPTPVVTTVLSTNATGAADPQAALRTFFGAVEAQDLQAFGAVWGDRSGAARDNIPREELEKRELTMLCYLKHDKYAILSDAPGTGGMHVFAVALSRGDLTRSANFDAVSGPGGRWYVQDFNMPALADLCKAK